MHPYLSAIWTIQYNISAEMQQSTLWSFVSSETLIPQYCNTWSVREGVANILQCNFRESGWGVQNVFFYMNIGVRLFFDINRLGWPHLMLSTCFLLQPVWFCPRRSSILGLMIVIAVVHEWHVRNWGCIGMTQVIPLHPHVRTPSRFLWWRCTPGSNLATTTPRNFEMWQCWDSWNVYKWKLATS